MAKKREWFVSIDDVVHSFKFTPNRWNGKHKFIIDGEDQYLHTSYKTTFAGLDQSFTVADKEVHLVIIRGEADLAVNNVFLNSRKEYLPLTGVPIWAWVFVIACAAIPIVSLGGAIPFMIGILGIMFCITFSVSPYEKLITKLIKCTGITVFAWIVYLLFISLVIELLS